MAEDDNNTELAVEIKNKQKTVVELTIDDTGDTPVIVAQNIEFEPIDLGQQAPTTPPFYYADLDGPIENVFYDESYAQLRRAIDETQDAVEHHILGVVFEEGFRITRSEWSIQVTETGTNQVVAMGPAENGTKYDYEGLSSPEWLRFRFSRRYQVQTPQDNTKIGLYDARLNEIDRYNQESTNPLYVAERTLPRPLNITLTRTVRGQPPQSWRATIDLRVQDQDLPNAPSGPTVRPNMTQLCQVRNSPMPAGYTENSVPDGVVPKKGGCKIPQDTGDPVENQNFISWAQLSQEERDKNLVDLDWYPIGYNNRVVCRYDQGFRMAGPNDVAVEVIELSPVTTFDNLAVEVSFDGEQGWRALPLMGIILSGTEKANVRGANNFLTFWRFRGLPNTASLTANKGFRLRIRDMSMHRLSLPETPNNLPVISGHPFWRMPSSAESAPGSDLVDLLVFSNPLEKFRFLFVLDHSGSMTGERIQKTHAATKLALAELAKLKNATGIGVEAAVHAFQNTVDLNGDKPKSNIPRNFSGWKAPDNPELLQFIDAQKADGLTPLYQAVMLIPQELAGGTGDTVDFAIVLSDGIHNVYTTEYKKKSDGSFERDQNGNRIPIEKAQAQAGASAVAELVQANQLPHKMFIFALELSGTSRTAIHNMGAEAPVYLDQELLELFQKHQVQAGARTVYLQRMQSQAGTTNYVALKTALQIITSIPDATLAPAEKTKIQSVVEERARAHVEVKDVDKSQLAEEFTKIAKKIIRASVACVECQDAREVPKGVGNYNF